ncbi:MAG: endo-1,4-beta-xylanase [Bacteroidales bacterium]|nr:endo-1,4-beta-xylanase [Bacteroidales bacterium]
MKKLLPIGLALMMAACAASDKNNETETSLAKAYEKYWYTGISVNQWETASDNNPQTKDWKVIVDNFNWVVAENCMKCEVVHPEQNRYDFTLADQFVDKALSANLKVMGHCLIWHSQCAKWFHYDSDGNLVSADTLKARMKEHITTVMQHFKGRVAAWDVCNECFEDDGAFRNSLFYQILGEDFIKLAFEYAHEADPDAELYYNDYSMNKASKVEAVANFFAPLVKNGLPLTAINMQGHIILDDGAQKIISDYEHSIETIKTVGVKTGFSELDLSVLPNPYGFSGANVSDKFAYRPEMDPYIDSLPAARQLEIDQFWIDFFKMLIKNRDEITRVNFWCLNDGNSWRNDFPIRGRKDYATLFDRDNKPKPTVAKLIELVRNKQ